MIGKRDRFGAVPSQAQFRATDIARGGVQRVTQAGGDAKDALSGRIQDLPMTGRWRVWVSGSSRAA